MSADRYPPATWKGDGDSGGSYTGVPWRVVLHTTETTGVPGYNGGGSAPHLTYQPSSRHWTQHTDLGVAARALRNLDGGVQTNRANALQVEIVCYSDRNIAEDSSSRLWVGDLDVLAYDDLRAFIDWTAHEYGVHKFWPGEQALSYSQANAAGFRMSGSAWEDFSGVCGHQHVPENDHWDPGALDWEQLMTIEQQNVEGPNGEPNWNEVSDWAKNAWTQAHKAGILTEDSHPARQSGSRANGRLPRPRQGHLTRRLSSHASSWSRRYSHCRPSGPNRAKCPGASPATRRRAKVRRVVRSQSATSVSVNHSGRGCPLEVCTRFAPESRLIQCATF